MCAIRITKGHVETANAAREEALEQDPHLRRREDEIAEEAEAGRTAAPPSGQAEEG